MSLFLYYKQFNIYCYGVQYKIRCMIRSQLQRQTKVVVGHLDNKNLE